MSLCWFCFYFAGGHLTNRCVFLLGGGGGGGGGGGTFSPFHSKVHLD